jgi:hypothetical protein
MIRLRVMIVAILHLQLAGINYGHNFNYISNGYSDSRNNLKYGVW